ncbi:MAG: DUF58 domain-containing protein [Chloroflexi bacterium]|nr:DUF58 domain-containing protein [Chloroflexota bacterium]
MKIRTIIFILLPLLLLLALAEGLVLVLRLSILLALVLLISYLWVLFGLRGIRIQTSQPPDYCQVGERFEKEVTLFNQSKLPKLLLKAAENTDIPGYHNMAVLNLPPGGSYHWQTDVHCRRRGQYSMGSVTVTTTDPFGLFSRQRDLGQPYPILIYPATLPLPFFESSPLSVLGYNSGYRSFSQISPNASSVREYTTGDSLNHIHWRSTAHAGNLMVKMFDTDHSHSGSKSVWVIIDMQQSLQLGEGDETTEEYVITIAASLIKKYIDSGMQVGLTASGDRPYFFPPERGEQHLRRLMETLALMKATGQIPVGQLISSQMEHFNSNSIAIVITPADSKEMIASIRQLKGRDNLAVSILLEPASFGGPASQLNTAHNLSANGIQVYTIRKGDEIARALDNRVPSLHTRYI